MLSTKRAFTASVALALCLAGAARADSPEKAGEHRIDLTQFTVGGIGLSSSVKDVRRIFGAPDEEQKMSAAQKEEERGEEIPVEKREAELDFNSLVCAYFEKGLKFVFDEDEKRLFSIDIYVSERPPYEEFTGAFAQKIPLEVREIQMLRPYASQIYKDRENLLYLKKNDDRPHRETAILTYDKDGWLSHIAFKREENLDIDIDRFCVAGICLGDRGKVAIERLGPPDIMNFRGRSYVAQWLREGLRIYARKKGGTIFRIVVGFKNFDGTFVQPLSLISRKEAFHDYLKGRIYQEGSDRIYAYRKGEPLSREKLVLKFDEDDRLNALNFDTVRNVEADLVKMVMAGVKVGDSPRRLRKTIGPFSKSREVRDEFALAYPRYGMRVLMEKPPEVSEKRKGMREETVKWPELGSVKQIEITAGMCRGLYSVPLSLADMMKDYEQKAARLIFRKKGDVLYLSQDGKPPEKGVAALIGFEKIGWPRTITLKEFQDIAVDMEKFTVAGIGLGTHADEVLRILGQPEKSHALKDRNLTVFQYLYKGLVVVIDRMDRSVEKIVIDMDTFEGAFVQSLTLDSGADDFEKILHKEIYKQSERKLWLTKDGQKPEWEEAAVNFSLTGRVDSIEFQTLAMKREGILVDITRDLDSVQSID